MNKEQSNNGPNGLIENIKGCLPIIIGVMIAAKIFNSCSDSKTGESVEETFNRESMSVSDDDAEEAMAAAFILGAMSAAEHENRQQQDNYLLSKKGQTTYECIYCCEERKSQLRRTVYGTHDEHPPMPIGRCPESPSGRHRWRRCRD